MRLDAIKEWVTKQRGNRDPNTIIMATEFFWAYHRAGFKMRTGENLKHEPITLRNPFTGEIFWMQS